MNEAAEKLIAQIDAARTTTAAWQAGHTGRTVEWLPDRDAGPVNVSSATRTVTRAPRDDSAATASSLLEEIDGRLGHADHVYPGIAQAISRDALSAVHNLVDDLGYRVADTQRMLEHATASARDTYDGACGLLDAYREMQSRATAAEEVNATLTVEVDSHRVVTQALIRHVNELEATIRKVHSRPGRLISAARHRAYKRTAESDAAAAAATGR